MQTRLHSALLTVVCLWFVTSIASAQVTRPYRGTTQSTRNIILRIENRSRTLHSDLDAWSSRNPSDTSAASDEDINLFVRDFDDSVRRLHGRFDRRQSTTADVQANRESWAVRFAAACDVVLVLKGANSLVSDGRRLYVNRTGNPGMATGGSGDVLTGLIAALVGQGLEPFAAAQLGTHLHGLAGDLARDELGEVSLIASDLLAYLARAFRSLGGGGASPSSGDEEI